VTKATKTKAEKLKKLVIVESPSKAKTINKYLGHDYHVLASKGHLIDLPKSKLGVNLENNFEPQYIPIRGKASVINEIKKAAKKASVVFIATDPDREGEAIGWHIRNFLSRVKEGAPPPPPLHRLRLNEITQSAIQEAIQSPSDVDLHMVNAQQGRRVMDRIVGYGISPLLWKHIRKGLSAGRVQSVALRLVFEREKEIGSFTPVEYWTLEAEFATGKGQTFLTRLAKVRGEKPSLPDEASVRTLLESLEKASFRIGNISSQERSKRGPLPFTTSKLQQEAYKRLKYSARRTMAIAQGLYEGVELGDQGPVGLITYMRTDSKRVSPEARAEAAKFIRETYGESYSDPAERVAAAGKIKVQDAHEAIRPTSVYRTPESLKAFLAPEQYRLYKLVWEDFLASQMSAARYRISTVEVEGGECLFRASGTETLFDGFTRVYQETADEDSNKEEGAEETEEVEPNQLPRVEVGEAVSWSRPIQSQHFTEPPPRYTDASLVKVLEERGIGRPSTYAPTLETIQNRRYVRKDGGRFFLNELGDLVIDILMKNFPVILDYEFTAKMEEELDEVETGEQEWHHVIRDFYEPFKTALAEADKIMGEQKIEVESDIPCEKCGRKMVVKWGRHGKFLACPGYPECQNTRGLKETTDGSIVPEDNSTDEKCPTCGGPMMFRMGRFGRFLACQRYPECKTTKAITLGIKCPTCGTGEIVSRRARMGRTFYGCNRYPECRFISWGKPVLRACPKCAHPYLAEKYTKALGPHVACPNKECDYTESPATPASETT
jgi:DNA topoisomerase-1